MHYDESKLCKNYVKKNTTTQKPAELSTEDKKKKINHYMYSKNVPF